MKFISVLTLLLVLSFGPAAAQRTAVKTNALGWATLSPNVGVEFCLSDRMSLAIDGSFNPWEIKGYTYKHFKVTPELRYWFSRPLYGHYLGLNAIAMTYKIDMFDRYYNGELIGVGLGYGYSFVLGKHWNLETSVGVGYGFRRETPKGMGASDRVWRHDLMATKLGISLVYIIK